MRSEAKYARTACISVAPISAGVTFSVKEDVIPDPIEVGSFSAVGVMFDADWIAQLVEGV